MYLTDADNGIVSAVHGSVEEVVRRLLEGGQHEDRLSHLGHSEPRDAQHLPLMFHQDTTPVTRHDVGFQFSAVTSELLAAGIVNEPLSQRIGLARSGPILGTLVVRNVLMVIWCGIICHWRPRAGLVPVNSFWWTATHDELLARTNVDILKLRVHRNR